MSEFQEWTKAAITLWGSADLTAAKFGVKAGRLNSWANEGGNPTLRQQYRIARSMNLPIEFVRAKLDSPWSSWAEWIAPLILDHGDVRSFCLKMDLRETTINTWLNCGALPRLNGIADLPKKLSKWSGGATSEEEIRSQMLQQVINAKSWRYNRRQRSRRPEKVAA